MMKNSDIIRQCYVNLTDALEKYQDNWMCDACYPDVINSIGFVRATFNRAISRHASQCGTHNALGIFIRQFQISCPYDSDSGQQRKVSCLYRQEAGKPPAAPSGPHIVRMCMLGPGQ